MSEQESLPLYSDRVGEALSYAAQVHSRQVRKGKREPYLSHVLAVTALVLHFGGSEEQVITAALHDAIEDQGGAQRAADIRARFGELISEMVLACTDHDTRRGARPNWRDRKKAYLDGLSDTDTLNVRLVEACDKLANLRDIVEDVRRDGVETLDRFSGGQDGVLWYYTELRNRLTDHVPQVRDEFTHLLGALTDAFNSDV